MRNRRGPLGGGSDRSVGSVGAARDSNPNRQTRSLVLRVSARPRDPLAYPLVLLSGHFHEAGRTLIPARHAGLGRNVVVLSGRGGQTGRLVTVARLVVISSPRAPDSSSGARLSKGQALLRGIATMWQRATSRRCATSTKRYRLARTLSLPPAGEYRLDVDNGRPVDSFEAPHEQPGSVDRGDGDPVQPDRVRPVLGAGAEHAGLRVPGIVARVDGQHVGLRLM
jgi:hypothetical protein